MSSAAHRSETELAKRGCAGLRAVKRARVLVSGLGMGFTLRATLDELADDAEVVVAELNPVVVEWCKGPLSALIANAAGDRRVTMEIVDVSKHIAASSRSYNAILLDMYEGPQIIVRPNEPFYGPPATRATIQALLPGGVFAVWTEAASPGFERALSHAGFRYELHRAGRGNLRHHVYVARSAPV